jgi:malic enzyme
MIVCDRSGVIYRGREKPVNQWKSAHAVDTEAHAGGSSGGRRRVPGPVGGGRAAG